SVSTQLYFSTRTRFTPFYCQSYTTSFFFLMRRPTPRSTLFPYTTLFRSRCEDRPRTWPSWCRNGGSREPTLPRAVGSRSESCPQDRKSTRLNSSHVAISYAVFCLKKKKKQYPSKPPVTSASIHISPSALP